MTEQHWKFDTTENIKLLLDNNQLVNLDHEYTPFNTKAEFTRQAIPKEHWRISLVNKDYAVH